MQRDPSQAEAVGYVVLAIGLLYILAQIGLWLLKYSVPVDVFGGKF